ncbi:MAG: hypothetical protein KJ645_01850, partial [Planctomycetes bacterium]|nr:hypothetical protein [Planctomycetota bacterium]
TGMTGLVLFTGGVGGPQFDWNNGGSGGALDLHDEAMGGDCGYYPAWVNNTVSYLENPSNSDVNVIIWSWCGQHASYSEQQMIDWYLAPMTQLEADYPDVKFVYMTGHLTYWSMENCNARNQQIRDYCVANHKILYDFAHIESFDPDGTYYPYANDDCTYWDAGGTSQGNWAQNWQNTHVVGEDWYDCYSAHSEALNANQKAYAAWWLWARLAGWEGPFTDSFALRTPEIPTSVGGNVLLDLNAGPDHANRTYLILGSASGTTPGFDLPGNLVTLPLNWDILTDNILLYTNTTYFPNFLGQLDDAGQSWAWINSGPLDHGLVGTTVHFAFTMNNPFNFASNAIPVSFVP